MIENNPYNFVKKIIGVMSGKGGVGKSTVSALIAEELNKKGYMSVFWIQILLVPVLQDFLK